MMKRNIHILPFVLASVILVSGCQKGLESEIAELKQRVQNLEAEVASLNSNFQNVSSLVSKIEENVFISDVQKLSDGSYRIVFADGSSVNLKNGTDGMTPIIGIRKYGEYYYWTEQWGEKGSWKWLEYNGDRVRASIITPVVRVNGKGDDAHWEYSYTGKEYDWFLLSGFGSDLPVHGYPGAETFEEVDCSFDGFVSITLADGSFFQIPTQKKFDELNAVCSTINDNVSIINDLVQNVDTMIFIREITRVEDEGQPAGYDIVFADGRTFSLRDGRDTTENRTLSIGWNTTLSKYCWMMGDEPVMYDGKAVVASPFDKAPELGLIAQEGLFYFTVKVGDGEPEMLLDAEGNPVLASPIRFLDKVEERNGQIILTLADKPITLVRMSDCTPSLHFPLQLLEAQMGVQDTITVSIDSLGIDSIGEFQYELEAVAMEGACVDSVGTGVLKDASPKRSIEHQIYFSLYGNAAVGEKIRIAVFLSWGSHTIMKVCEITVKEPGPEPEAIVPE